MANEPNEQDFVKELVSSREYLFSQLADMNDEKGKHNRAKAWRWLRDFRKWPSKRQFKRGWLDYNESDKNKRWKYHKYGWSFRRTVGLQREAEEKDSGPTLFYDLVDYCHMSATELYETEEAAIRYAVYFLERWFARLERMEQAKKEREEREAAEQAASGN